MPITLRRASTVIGLIAVVGGFGLSGCVATKVEPAAEVAEHYPVADATEVSETKAPDLPMATQPQPGEPLVRSGDEIMVAGQLFHTGTPVVLWIDPEGYDGYRVERRFAALNRSDWESSKTDNQALSTPNRYGMRSAVLNAAEIEQVRGGGWDLPLLQHVVDQFVLHYDAAGTSRRCFERLHDDRGLSIHFMLDVDGTIYQTLDLKERAWHATVANSRSIGIEIANVGAYTDAAAKPLKSWYRKDADGRTELVIPSEAMPGANRHQNASLRPIRDDIVAGSIRGETLYQYDLTAAQYDALTKLTAALCTVFPRLKCDYPRNADGSPLMETMAEADWKSFQGLIGHFHIQNNKVDPGPALQWERIVKGARELLKPGTSSSP